MVRKIIHGLRPEGTCSCPSSADMSKLIHEYGTETVRDNEKVLIYGDYRIETS